MKQLLFSFCIGFLLLVGLESCVYVNSDDNIPPRGESTRTFDFRNFDELEMSHAFRVHVQAGAAFSVFATGELNDLDDLSIFVQNGKLVARYNNSWKNNRRPMDIYITMPVLEAVDFSGAVNASVEGFKNLSTLEFELSGASRCDFDGTAQSLAFDLSGASELNLFGHSRYLDGELSGASKLNAFDLSAEESDLDLSGASSARVWITNFLDVEASGASRVRYKGNPGIKQKLSGGSSLRPE
jgi:hypothetical protein